MKFYLVITVIIVALALNTAVSIFLVKRDDLDSFQKKAQIVIVWLLPFIAAIGLYLINRSHDTKYKKGKGEGGDTSAVDSGHGGDGGD